MYKNIMVAVDSSKISNQVMEEAINLAKTMNAKLRIIHIVNKQFVDYSGIGIDCTEYNEAAIKSGNILLKKMQKLASKAGIQFDSKLIELKILEGRIEEKIIEAAKSWSADLLMIGTHGYRGFSHFLLGSIAEGVIRISPIPVLLIRGGSE